MPPEVLIYIQTVKNYFKTNSEARDYFLNGNDEDLFFKHLSEISQKNFEKNGEVMLDKNQFELLRTTTMVITIAVKEDFPEEKTIDEKIFQDFGGFGKICLN